MPDLNAPQSHLRVENYSQELLELMVEPYGRDYWMRPGEVLIVTTVASDRGDPFPGTTRPDEPFEVDYRLRSITVHSNGIDAYITDASGNYLECGYQRP